MKELEPYKRPDGSIDCDVNITTEEWLDILKEGMIDDLCFQYLHAFLRAEDHKSTCKEISQMSKRWNTSSIIAKIVDFAKKVQGELNRFTIRDNGNPVYWVIPMTGKELSDGMFELQLRDELAEAIKKYLFWLKDEFLKAFPISSLSRMKLSDYTNLNKDDSFCYWVELRLKGLGGIQGATAFKFGIYEYESKPESNPKQYLYDNKYAWQARFGKNAKEAFANVRKMVQEVAIAAENGDYETIDGIELSPMFKWKIAYLYGNMEIVPIFKEEMLQKAADSQGMKNAYSASFVEVQRYLMAKFTGNDSLEYYHKLLRAAKEVNKEAENVENEVKYWLAGYSFGSTENQLDRFIKDGIWEGGGDNKVNEMIKKITKNDVLIMKSTGTKGSKHDISFLRVKGIGIVESDKAILLADGHYQLKVRYKMLEAEKDFIGGKYFKYNRTMNECDDDEIIKLANEIMNKKEYDSYIEHLRKCKNMVLTGAPGTGKTFMAKAIAEEMGAESCFVQFHPSYDYTDFVEGLRPIKDDSGNIGFERKDGVFKAFCAKAAQNAIDSEKTVETLEKEYVFIIDEINRGELSKIFGELFFAIDPGYRGTKGRVNTQYQNMVTEKPFAEGFYVPDNVYIIGTMNDIDRSVESMDFAIRRRFAWVEVKASDTAEKILKGKPYKDEALRRMENLNNTIEEMLGAAYQIGGSYFLKLDDYNGDFNQLWKFHLKGVLAEYLRGMRDASSKIDKLEQSYNA